MAGFIVDPSRWPWQPDGDVVWLDPSSTTCAVFCWGLESRGSTSGKPLSSFGKKVKSLQALLVSVGPCCSAEQYYFCSQVWRPKGLKTVSFLYPNLRSPFVTDGGYAP